MMLSRMSDSQLTEPTDRCHSLPVDLQKRPHPPVPQGLQPGEYIELLNQEIALHIGMLYFLVEVFRSDDTFGDELSTLSL